MRDVLKSFLMYGQHQAHPCNNLSICCDLNTWQISLTCNRQFKENCQTKDSSLFSHTSISRDTESVGVSFGHETLNQLVSCDEPIGVESEDEAGHEAHLTGRSQDMEVKVGNRTEWGPVEPKPDITHISYTVSLQDLLPCLNHAFH